MMKSQSYKLLVGVAFVLLIGFWLAMASCPKYLPNTLNTPDYIGAVWPPPDSHTGLGCYIRRNIRIFLFPFTTDGGVSVEIAPIHLLSLEQVSSDEKNILPFQDRISLFVDKKLVLDSRVVSGGSIVTGIGSDPGPFSGPDLAAWYHFSSTPFLLPGDHTAKVTIETLSGEKIEYEWQFIIAFP